MLYSGAASTRQCFDGMLGLRAQLPDETQHVLTRHEEAGTTDHPEYQHVIDILLHRHLCRIDPRPPLLADSMARMAVSVYELMWGPNEFTCTGTLMGWDRTDHLGELTVPTLVLCGKYDEVIPACSETLHQGIKGSQFVLFENSSHLTHLEEPDQFYPVIRSFLRKISTVSDPFRHGSV
jgi:proline-specific peptidase